MARPAPGTERTVALITFLADHSGRSFSLSELARRLQLDKATAHATLAALNDAPGFRDRLSADEVPAYANRLVQSAAITAATNGRHPPKEVGRKIGSLADAD
jgi:hypothetical protein